MSLLLIKSDEQASTHMDKIKKVIHMRNFSRTEKDQPTQPRPSAYRAMGQRPQPLQDKTFNKRFLGALAQLFDQSFLTQRLPFIATELDINEGHRRA